MSTFLGVVAVWERIKDFFGLFNLTRFEAELIRVFEAGLPDDERAIFGDQFSRFNRVSRITKHDERLTHGDTTFYWMRRGRSQIAEFPKRIATGREECQIAKCFVTDETGTIIEVRFMSVVGVVCVLEYWSKDNVYHPKGRFSIGPVEYSLTNELR